MKKYLARVVTPTLAVVSMLLERLPRWLQALTEHCQTSLGKVLERDLACQWDGLEKHSSEGAVEAAAAERDVLRVTQLTATWEALLPNLETCPFRLPAKVETQDFASLR